MSASAPLRVLLIACVLALGFAAQANAAASLTFEEFGDSGTSRSLMAGGLDTTATYEVVATLADTSTTTVACARPYSPPYVSCKATSLPAAVTYGLRKVGTTTIVSSMQPDWVAARADRTLDLVTGRGRPNTPYSVIVVPKAGTATRQIDVTTDASGLLSASFASGPSAFDFHVWDKVSVLRIDASGHAYRHVVRQGQIAVTGPKSADLEDMPGDYTSVQLLNPNGTARDTVRAVTSNRVTFGQTIRGGDIIRVKDTGGVSVLQMTVPGMLDDARLSPDAERVAGKFRAASGVAMSSLTFTTSYGNGFAVVPDATNTLTVAADGSFDQTLPLASLNGTSQPASLSTSIVNTEIAAFTADDHKVNTSVKLPSMSLDLGSGRLYVSLSGLTGASTAASSSGVPAAGCARVQVGSGAITPLASVTDNMTLACEAQLGTSSLIGKDIKILDASGNVLNQMRPADFEVVDIADTSRPFDRTVAWPLVKFDANEWKTPVGVEGIFSDGNRSANPMYQSRVSGGCVSTGMCDIKFTNAYTEGSSFAFGVVQKNRVRNAVHRRFAGTPAAPPAIPLVYTYTTGSLSSARSMAGQWTVSITAPDGTVRLTKPVTVSTGSLLSTSLLNASGEVVALAGDTITAVSASQTLTMRVSPPRIRLLDRAAGRFEAALPTGVAAADGVLKSPSGTTYTLDANGVATTPIILTQSEVPASVQWIDSAGNVTDTKAQLWNFTSSIAPAPAALTVLGGTTGATSVRVVRNGSVITNVALKRTPTFIVPQNELPSTLLPGDRIEISNGTETAADALPSVASVVDVARDRVFVTGPANGRLWMAARGVIDTADTTLPASGEVSVQYGVAGRSAVDLRSGDDVVVRHRVGWSFVHDAPRLPGITVDLGTRNMTWDRLPAGQYKASIVCGTDITTAPNFTASPGGSVSGTSFATMPIAPGCTVLTRSTSGADVAAPEAPFLTGSVDYATSTLSVNSAPNSDVKVTYVGASPVTLRTNASGVATAVVPVAARASSLTLSLVDSHSATWTRSVPAATAPVVDPPVVTPPTTTPPTTTVPPSTVPPSTVPPNGGGTNNGGGNNTGIGNNGGQNNTGMGTGTPPRDSVTPPVKQPERPLPNLRGETTSIAASGARVSRDDGVAVTIPPNAFTGAVLQVDPASTPQDTTAAQKAFTRGFAAGSAFVNVTIHDAGGLAGELDVHDLPVPIRVIVPIPATDETLDAQLAPAWFSDGMWKLSPKIKPYLLPRELPDGYWVERQADGSRLVIFLTRHLTEFGVLKDVTAPQWSGKAAPFKASGRGAQRTITWRAAIDGFGIASYRVLVNGKAAGTFGAAKRSAKTKVRAGRANQVCVEATDLGGNRTKRCITVR